MEYSILGAEGFIGSHVAKQLKAKQIPYRAYTRDLLNHLDQPLGHLLYCIGLTSDFRERPFDTAEAHVHVLSQILQRGNFQSLTYLSSTRLYQGAASTEEKAPLVVNVLEPGDLFNTSKLLGESLCLWSGRNNVKAVRVSNVIGPRKDNHVFLDQVLHEAFATGEVVFQTAPDSCKDFVHVDDVAAMILRVASEGHQSIYNLAAGANVSNQEIGEILASEFGIRVHYAPQARTWAFSPIDISRLKTEFGYCPRLFQDYIIDYIADFRKRNSS